MEAIDMENHEEIKRLLFEQTNFSNTVKAVSRILEEI